MASDAYEKNRTAYNSIASEIAQLNAFLAAIPEEDVIDRLSLVARLEKATESLKTIKHELI
jgi:hypothetical protein